MHVLIVEDDTFLSKILTDILTGAGYQVSCIADGQQAWERLSQPEAVSYDLILLDRILPGIDGLNILKKIKGVDHLKDVPVVIETGLDDGDSIREGLNAGAYYYLTKPVHHQLLLTVVNAALDDVRETKAVSLALQQTDEALKFLQSAIFSCQTLEEAKILAHLLAKVFPEPERVVMGLTELLVNAVEHGNLEISYAEKTQLLMQGKIFTEIEDRLRQANYASRRVKIELTKQAHRIMVTIVDEGKGFNWQDYMDFSTERAFDPHGRGIAMANKNCFDRLEYQGRGNIVSVSVNTFSNR